MLGRAFQVCLGSQDAMLIQCDDAERHDRNLCELCLVVRLPCEHDRALRSQAVPAGEDGA